DRLGLRGRALRKSGYVRQAVCSLGCADGTPRVSLAPRLVSSEKRGEDADVSLRPQTIDDFVGQGAVRANLKVFVEAAKGRGEALDHVLFVGPPGLGKTTLAQIMAREMGVNFRSTSGPVIAK